MRTIVTKTNSFALDPEYDYFLNNKDFDKMIGYTAMKNEKGEWVNVPNPGTTAPPASAATGTKYCGHENDYAYTTVAAAIDFYGATSYYANPAGFDVVLDLGRSKASDLSGAIDAADRVVQGIMSGPDSYMEINQYLLGAPKFVDLIWPDFGTPIYAGYDFWAALAKEIIKEQPAKVLVSCMGGHGRTGTCLAILIGMIDDLQGAETIPAIRDIYCKKAIETPAQEDYVIDVLSGKF